MSIRMRRCADARVHGCTDKRRRCDHAERQRESLKNPSKILGFLAFSVRARPSARSKFLGGPRAKPRARILKKPIKNTSFLEFSARARPSATSKFLGGPMANSVEPRWQILRKPSKRIPFGFLGYPPGGFNEDRKGN